MGVGKRCVERLTESHKIWRSWLWQVDAGLCHSNEIKAEKLSSVC